ncbi:unnamed protein product [Mytilus edulis]|uniref:Uncharacterized protein n=1 Tax=Mytilus edulis TaxID=6550 RepID=A0A8S3V451_MYTED|nr:unnamed protein product [Mytilus edulis]
MITLRLRSDRLTPIRKPPSYLQDFECNKHNLDICKCKHYEETIRKMLLEWKVAAGIINDESRIKDIKEDPEVNEKEKIRKIAKEEDELTIMHHELQKGTDSLRKACCIKVVQLQKLLQTIYIPENSDNGNESGVSASSIVEDILDQGLGENGKYNRDEEEDD